MSTLQSAPAASPAIRNTLGVAAYYLDGPHKAKQAWRELEAQYAPAAHNLRLLTAPSQASCASPELGAPRPRSRDEHVEEMAVGMYAEGLTPQWGTPQQRRIALGQDTFTIAQYPNAIQTFAQEKIIRMIHVQAGYQGMTALGIQIGDDLDTIRARYGPPTRILPVRNGQSWGYETAGIAFQLRQGKLVSWLV